MAATSRSFSRATPSSPAASPTTPLNPGIKLGANGVSFISSGIPDLDKILGGGFALGSLVMIMEDEDAPHHLLLLRNFMSQGIVHRQPVLFGSPLKDPRAFLGTLPSPLSSSSSKDDKLRLPSGVDSGQKEQEKNLRIAWQYKKYFGDQHAQEQTRDVMQDFSHNFDLRKSLERQFLNPQYVDCINFQDTPDLQVLQDRCFSFLSNFSRNHGGSLGAGRIAIQSLCSPQCRFSERDWHMVSVIKSLRAMIKSSNAVAVITFPTSFLPPSFLKRWQHLADTLLSVKAIPDEDKDLAKLLTGYQDMLGLLHVHKIAQINTQVPTVLEAPTYSLKLLKRRSLVLELLNQAPVDGSSGTSYATSSSCFGSSNNSLEF